MVVKQYLSGVMASIHETAEGGHAAEPLERKTMRVFDDACLPSVRALSPAEIGALREREGASQAVFARNLNVTVDLISPWERGEKHPRGPSLKLLALVEERGPVTVVRGRWGLVTVFRTGRPPRGNPERSAVVTSLRNCSCYAEMKRWREVKC